MSIQKVQPVFRHALVILQKAQVVLTDAARFRSPRSSLHCPTRTCCSRGFETAPPCSGSQHRHNAVCTRRRCATAAPSRPAWLAGIEEPPTPPSPRFFRFGAFSSVRPSSDVASSRWCSGTQATHRYMDPSLPQHEGHTKVMQGPRRLPKGYEGTQPATGLQRGH